VITIEAVHAWCLVNGAWVEHEDPVMAVCDPYGGDVRAAMAGLGYEAWCQIGAEELPAVPVSLTLYSREAPPLQFLLQIEGNAGNVVEHVFAETLPDAMELLARWAPIARTGGRSAPYARDGARPTGEGRHQQDVRGHLEDGCARADDGDRPDRREVRTVPPIPPPSAGLPGSPAG
jgi:hypothetical protein